MVCPSVTELHDFNPETIVEMTFGTSHEYSSTMHVYCNGSNSSSGGGQNDTDRSLADGLTEMFSTCTSVGEWSHTFSSCSGMIGFFYNRIIDIIKMVPSLS